MALKVLLDRVVIRPIDTDEIRNGIYIPETAREKPRQGIIIAVGPGKVDSKGTLTPTVVKEGDWVLFGKHTGSDIVIKNEKLLLLRESDLFAILEVESA